MSLEKPNPFRHPISRAIGWLRQHWRQPNPHTETKLHRACRDFARHFRAVRVQFPVFYLLGGFGAAGGVLFATREQLDPLAVAEWTVVGFVGIPALVCVVIFGVVRWRTPTRQRDDARIALVQRDEEIAALHLRAAIAEKDRDEALVRLRHAEGARPVQHIREQHNYYRIEHPPDIGNAELREERARLLSSESQPARPPEQTSAPQAEPDATSDHPDTGHSGARPA